MVNAGRILILTKGDWSSLVTYEQLDLVSDGDVAYLARQASVGVRPSTDTSKTYWQPFGSVSSIATTTEPGLVMPDGDTIKIGTGGLIYVDMDASDLDYDNTQTGISATDVQSAIDTAVVNAQMALDGIGPIETSSTASQGYAKGDFFFYNGKLYVCTLAFAQGAMIIPGTNCQLTTVGAQLKAKADSTAVTTLDGKAYKTDDSTENTIDDADFIPFYDTSASAKKKIKVEDLNLGGGSGGSVITVTTQESDLHGKTVNITDGVLTFSGTFNNNGVAVIEGVTITGTLTVTAQGTSDIATEQITVPYYGNYEIELNFYIVYGFHVDSTVSDPSNAVSYQVQYNNKNVANYSYTRASMDFTNDVWSWGSWSEDMFFMPKPCLVKQDYSEIIYLNPNDYTKDVNGNDVTSKLTGTTDGYNAMVEWGKNGKKIWYKLVPDSGDATSYTVYIANKQVDNGFVAWSFYDANNQLADHFYTSIFNGAVVSNVLRSLSGKAPNNTTAGANQISYAKANNKNGESYAWYIDVYADRVLINLLLILVIKSLNSDVVGYGNYSGGSSASSLINTGTGNTKGAFYGKQSNGVVKIFHMENWFANCWRRMAGLVLNSGVQLYKMTYGTADGSSAAGYIENDNAPSNYLTGASIATNLSSSYITKQTAKTDGSLLASAFGGANGTYYSDACWTSTGAKYAHVGGGCHGSSACGAFTLALCYALSDSYWHNGCALSLKPLAE